MAHRRFFHPNLSKGVVELSPEESHHALTAPRTGEGDELVLFDGAGREAVGRVARIDRRAVHVEIGEVAFFPFDVEPEVTLAVASVRANRQNYLIEKCTELGVAAIWPMVTARSVVRPHVGATAKWKRRAVEAAKQSRRRWLPQIEEPQSFELCLQRASAFDGMAMADTVGAAVPFPALLVERAKGGTVLVLIGPEGGWTDEEREKAMVAGARPVFLSPTVLRVETAAVAVCAVAAMCSMR